VKKLKIDEIIDTDDDQEYGSDQESNKNSESDLPEDKISNNSNEEEYQEVEEIVDYI